MKVVAAEEYSYGLSNGAGSVEIKLSWTAGEFPISVSASCYGRLEPADAVAYLRHVREIASEAIIRIEQREKGEGRDVA